MPTHGHMFAILKKPARKVIRREAKHLLKKADRAVARLKDPRDVEALHDARVALRKLRAWFQAFRDELPLKRRHRHALRDLAHSTNDARDAEVGLAWVAGLRPPRPGVEQFASDLEMLRDDSYRQVREELPSAWHKLSRKLLREARHPAAPTSRFGKRFAASLREHAGDFELARRRASREPSPANIHRLRIEGKKLRYLVDAVLKSEPAGASFMSEMEALHDSAGAIQDLQRLRLLSERDFLLQADQRYRHLLAAPAQVRRQPDLAPGLKPMLQIGRRVGQEQNGRIAGFRKAYLGRQRPRCVQELQGLLRQVS